MPEYSDYDTRTRREKHEADSPENYIPQACNKRFAHEILREMKERARGRGKSKPKKKEIKKS